MRTLILSLLVSLVFISCQSQSNHNCPFPYTNHQPEDQCGFVEVPRNWDASNSETTRLGYLVITSKSEQRKDDPVIFLQGGPGGSVLSLANIYSQLQFDTDRDFILFDQRGVGFSEELCPGLNLKLLEIMAADLTIDDEISQLKASVLPCVERIKTDGRQFSTTTNAKDLEALRQHLGYKTLNLFGGSYGTRLGLKYMELYPAKVRSAVLSGLFPLELRMYDALFSNFNNSLNLLFERCTASPDCHSKYPELKATFLAMYSDLKNNPISIDVQGTPFIINQQDVLLFMHQMLYRDDTIERIPEFIKALEQRDLDYISSVTTLFVPRITLINLAVYYAIMTADEGKFDNQGKLDADSKHEIFSDTGLSLFSADPEVISSWYSVPVASNTMVAVNSAIPTLLVSGEFDPVTPPSNGNTVAKGLKNSQHVIFKNNGHVPINNCFFNLAKAFLDAPTKPLATACSKQKAVLNWD
ncbi:alpha/beta fold hydrolase [Winogradskyella sp.]|uniref:alpha/beta fold hydrolase n=1 Tax=Winogradskyella sp. TaxID=1883156 RepID=UPI001B1F8686|nr:alpha/beta fold hydrolase [Winogradskyella sp.]MBO6880909.1 alpha/beta fold hydrolase [Winogradskyella sp.]